MYLDHEGNHKGNIKKWFTGALMQTWNRAFTQSRGPERPFRTLIQRGYRPAQSAHETHCTSVLSLTLVPIFHCSFFEFRMFLRSKEQKIQNWMVLHVKGM